MECRVWPEVFPEIKPWRTVDGSKTTLSKRRAQSDSLHLQKNFLPYGIKLFEENSVWKFLEGIAKQKALEKV